MVDGGAEGVRTPDLLNAIQAYLLTCIAVCEELLFGGGWCQPTNVQLGLVLTDRTDAVHGESVGWHCEALQLPFLHAGKSG